MIRQYKEQNTIISLIFLKKPNKILNHSGKLIKHLIREEAVKNENIFLKDFGGQKVFDSVGIANILNSFLFIVESDLRENIKL